MSACAKVTRLNRTWWFSGALIGICFGSGCSGTENPVGAGGSPPTVAGTSSVSAGTSGAPSPTGGTSAGGSSGASPGGSTTGGSGLPVTGGTTSAGSAGASPAGAPNTSGGAPSGSAGNGAAGSNSAGEAGSAGGTPSGSAGAPGTAGSGNTPGNGFITEDFESGTVGQQPAGWDNFVGWVKNGNNTATGQAFALVDDSKKHGGTKSIHFKGGQQPAMITRALPNGTNKLYVRAWVYMTRQLGQNPGANHETLIGIRKESGGANDEIRFGEIKGAIGTNEVPSDNISPKMDLWGKGPVIPKDTWVCLEVAFLADEAQHKLHAWADGTLVHEVTSGDQWQNGTMPATWMNGKFVEVILGWHSFSSQDIEVWMDDIVLATSRVGCQ